MSKDELREQVAQGARARELLDDEVLAQAFEALERRYIETWRSSSAEDSVGREKLYWALQGLDYARRELRIMLDNGNIAASQLEQSKE